jgi:hypothetical protein
MQNSFKHTLYIGKSISKLQMDTELKQTRVLTGKILLFLNIISLYIEALVPSFHKPPKTSSIKFFELLLDPSPYSTWKQTADLQTQLTQCNSWSGNTIRVNVQAGKEVCPLALHPLNCFTLLSRYRVVLKCVLCVCKWKEKLLLERANKPHSNISSVIYHFAMWDAFWNIIRSEMWRFKIRMSTNICFCMF